MNAATIFTVLLGLFIRLLVPLALTTLVVYWLRKLDARWQLEAKKERNLLLMNQTPCWIERGLSVEEGLSRSAASEQPCWQSHRSANGHLLEACLTCDVFRSAPAHHPNIKYSHAHV